jgi:hypothetical protein
MEVAVIVFPSLRCLPRLERLEDRALPSADGWAAVPSLAFDPLATSARQVVYTPAQVRHAYGFDRVPSDGTGQTIAVVVAHDDPTLVTDLATFDATFGLPGQSAAGVNAFLTRVNSAGGAALPSPDRLWASEIALDTEWAHAIAPRARLLLVEAGGSDTASLLAAIDYARRQPGVSVVSMSWGGAEFASEGGYDGYFATPAGHAGVTFVAAAGDSSALFGAEWPAVSPGVLAVGGTSLSLDAANNRSAETAWFYGGGGYSRFEAEPAFQRPLQAGGRRAVPDVAYDADPATGLYVYSATNGGWLAAGGTSVGAPQWAGLIALVNQARARVGLGPLANAPAALAALPAGAFYDVSRGSNGYLAGVGFDLATGRGTPHADLIILDLSRAPSGGSPGFTALTSGPSSRSVAAADALPPDGPGGPFGAADAPDPTLLAALLARQADAVWSAPATAAPRFVAPVTPGADGAVRELARLAAQDAAQQALLLYGGTAEADGRGGWLPDATQTGPEQEADRRE